MPDIKIYHNPKCTKSRQALALLKEKGFEPEIIEYLKTPPDAATIRLLLTQLGLQPRDILRKQEKEFADAGLENDGLSDDDIINAIVKFPKLLERPIVQRGDRAAIGRPTENILPLLD